MLKPDGESPMKPFEAALKRSRNTVLRDGRSVRFLRTGIGNVNDLATVAHSPSQADLPGCERPIARQTQCCSPIPDGYIPRRGPDPGGENFS